MTGLLPAKLAYRVAIARGDMLYALDPDTRKRVEQSIKTGMRSKEFVPNLPSLTRAWFRYFSCNTVDAMRLLGDGRALSRLVDVRGLDNLDTAIARGKGVVIFCSHLGSRATFPLLGALGYPVTMIGRGNFLDDVNKPILLRMFHRLYRGRPVNAHTRASGISNRPGLFGAAAKAAVALRGNAIVGIAIDAKLKSLDVSRPVAVTFLNKQVLKAPGAISIAQLTGAPLLMISIHRKEDWCHQVIEISPPVSVEGETADVFARCLALVEADIRRYPAQYAWGLEGFWRLDPDEVGQDFA